MKEKKKNIIIALLSVIIVLLVGFIVLAATGTISFESNDVDLKYYLPNRKSILLISGTDSQMFLTKRINNFKCGSIEEGKYKESPLSVMVDINGDAYLRVDCMIGTNDSRTHIDETNSFIKILEEKNGIKFSKYNIDSYGEILAYKLPISNVAIAYNMYFMTGGGYYFVFVLNDGKVAAMTDNEIISSGKISIKTFDNLDNILYITDCGMNGANCEPFAVNNDGEEIYLLPYFTKWFNEYFR